jgi:hypothetical protein
MHSLAGLSFVASVVVKCKLTFFVMTKLVPAISLLAKGPNGVDSEHGEVFCTNG